MSDTDPTAPWYEFISYCRCCDSLGIPIRLQSFMRYQQYLKEIGLGEGVTNHLINLRIILHLFFSDTVDNA